MTRSPLFVALAVAGACPFAAAQTQILVAEGDVLAGVGTVADVYDVAIGEGGRWAAAVTLDGDTTPGSVLLLDGAVFLQAPLQLGGIDIEWFGGLEFDAEGEVTWLADWQTSSTLWPTSRGAFVGTLPLAVEGQPLDVAGVPAGWTVRGVKQLRPGAAGEWWVSVDGPIASPIHQSALVRFELGAGGLVGTSVVTAGQTHAGYGPIHDFSPAPYALAANRFGQYVFSPGMSHSEHAVFVGSTKVAENTKPAVMFGHYWQYVERGAYAINDAGLHAFSSRIFSPSGTSDVVMTNGLVLARTGDTLPAIAPYAFDRLFVGAPISGGDPEVAAPLHVTTDGQTVWLGGWNAPAPEGDLGIFFDHTLVLREGEAVVAGQRLVDFLPAGQPFARPMFDVDRGGKTIALRGRLEDGRVAAVRIVPAGSVTTIEGCVGNAGTLQANIVGGPGGLVMLSVGAAQAVGAHALAILSLAPFADGCGLLLPGVGELLVSPQPGDLVGTAPGMFPALASLQSVVQIGPIPTDPLLAGLHVFAQVVWIDASPGAVEPLRLTNALEIQLAH